MSFDIEPTAFSAFEREAWEMCANQYPRYLGLLTEQIGNKLLEAADPRPSGKALLDVATGPGYLAKEAKRRGFAKVTGIDFSDAMIALANVDAGGVEFRVGDAQRLDEPDESFDVVTMNFGLLHLSFPEKAISEAHRVLRAGGRFAFSVWAEPERALGFSILLDAIERHADKSLSLPPAPPFFHFSSSANSMRALRDGGFADCIVQDVNMTWTLDSAETLFNTFFWGTARTGGLMRMQTPDTVAKIKETLAKNAAGFWRENQLCIPMSAVVAMGTK